MSHIRQADVTDSDAVFALLQDFATSYRPQREAFERTFERLLAAMTYDDGADLLVADDGAVVGYVLATRFLTLYANGPVTELQELFVDPAHRGQGLGRRLVAAIAGRARDRAVVELTVPTRRAGDFYRGLGFTETAAFFKLSLTAQ